MISLWWLMLIIISSNILQFLLYWLKQLSVNDLLNYEGNSIGHFGHVWHVTFTFLHTKIQIIIIEMMATALTIMVKISAMTMVRMSSMNKKQEMNSVCTHARLSLSTLHLMSVFIIKRSIFYTKNSIPSPLSDHPYHCI